MADIETLQAENEKLNGRLRKAIQVFNQQKADIERLETETCAYEVGIDAALYQANALRTIEVDIAE